MNDDIGGNLLVESVCEIAFEKFEISDVEKPIFSRGLKMVKPNDTSK